MYPDLTSNANAPNNTITKRIEIDFEVLGKQTDFTDDALSIDTIDELVRDNTNAEFIRND